MFRRERRGGLHVYRGGRGGGYLQVQGGTRDGGRLPVWLPRPVIKQQCNEDQV